MTHSTLALRRRALRPVALAVALIAAGGCALAQAQAAASAEASLPAVPSTHHAPMGLLQHGWVLHRSLFQARAPPAALRA